MVSLKKVLKQHIKRKKIIKKRRHLNLFSRCSVFQSVPWALERFCICGVRLIILPAVKTSSLATPFGCPPEGHNDWIKGGVLGLDLWVLVGSCEGERDTTLTDEALSHLTSRSDRAHVSSWTVWEFAFIFLLFSFFLLKSERSLI